MIRYLYWHKHAYVKDTLPKSEGNIYTNTCLYSYTYIYTVRDREYVGHAYPCRVKGHAMWRVPYVSPHGTRVFLCPIRGHGRLLEVSVLHIGFLYTCMSMYRCFSVNWWFGLYIFALWRTCSQRFGGFCWWFGPQYNWKQDSWGLSFTHRPTLLNSF